MSDRLPSIDRTINPENSINSQSKEKFSYYKALKDLKDVNKKVSVIKNRLNYLTVKDHQIENPIANYFQDRQIRLRTQVNQDQSKLKEELSLKRLKSQSQLQLKRSSNYVRKRETLQKIEKAKKGVIQQKYKYHQQVREKSKQNLSSIQMFKKSFLVEKQTKRQLLYNHQKRQREFFEQMQLQKIKQIREECEEETSHIYKQIEQKTKELRTIEQECNQIERKQRQRLVRMRERKIEKMKYSRRIVTLQTRSTIHINKDKEERSTSPHSFMSFVVIS